MSDEQSIRGEIADEIAGVVTGEGYYSTTIGIDAARDAADLLLASPVIRRIQAEAIRWLHDRLRYILEDPAGDFYLEPEFEREFEQTLDRIEKGKP